MANDEHVALLKKGVTAWNQWRDDNVNTLPDLRGANLTTHVRWADVSRSSFLGTGHRKVLVETHLHRANLSGTDLSGADLTQASLEGANLVGADLSQAKLSEANLNEASLRVANLTAANLYWASLTLADLSGAYLSEANLSGASLRVTNLSGANLAGTDLSEALLIKTVFGGATLFGARGLDLCRHMGPSVIDFQTLKNSVPLPRVFLRGVGLPDRLIDYLPSLLNEAIQYYSCFISYSSKDDAFAERLYTDLQNKGVRCWYAHHDMPIGAKIVDALDEAIRLRDKVLLILSEGAVASDWVEDEVTTAFEEERRRGEVVLFPVRIDEAVMQTSEAWAARLRARHIGDFTRWKEPDSYQKSFERLMRDLRVETSKQ